MQENNNALSTRVKRKIYADIRGWKTDRGKIYIKFGDPYNIERSSTELGYIMETWNYNNPNQTFIFIDKQGTGNFVLIDG